MSLLHDVALHAPSFRIRADEIDQTRWIELLEPLTALLEQRGLPTRPTSVTISNTQVPT